MFKKLLTDWSFWLLLLFNVYLLYYYQQNPAEFRTLIFLYWAQSAIIGVANFFDIATIYKIKPGSLEVNGKPVEDKASTKGCMAFFFLVHYGLFHLVYLIFLFIKTRGPVDYNLLKIGIGIICLNVSIDFIRKKIQQRHEETNLGKTFFTPYIRIVPMHIIIMLPEFFRLSNATVFIVLKILMDLVMHIVTSGYYKKGIAPVSSVAE